jgi:hypothetical protein
MYKFSMNFFMLTITNMVVLNLGAIFGKFKIFRMCNSGNYAQNWVTKLYNQKCLVSASLTI